MSVSKVEEQSLLRHIHVISLFIIVSFSPVCCEGGGQVAAPGRGRVATNTTTGTLQVRGHKPEEKTCIEKDLYSKAIDN